jgi:hypothetical protein
LNYVSAKWRQRQREYERNQGTRMTRKITFFYLISYKMTVVIAGERVKN